MDIHFNDWHWLLQTLSRSYLIEFIRYLIAALLFWGILHVVLRRRLSHRLIGLWPSGADVRREIAHSLLSMLVFACVGLLIYFMVAQHRWVIYHNPHQYGHLWYYASFFALMVWHDTYFYWTHRLMHTRWFLRYVHGLHHRSRHPSPWAAYAFHPLEAFINALPTPLLLCAVPMPGVMIFYYGLFQVLRNAHGHAAVETMPRGFAKHWFWGHLTTTTHHHLHHETAKGNYGLWFTWWDRLCGTENAAYMQRFDSATQPAITPYVAL